MDACNGLRRVVKMLTSPSSSLTGSARDARERQGFRSVAHGTDYNHGEDEKDQN